jgi:hypothetical protein
MAMSRTNAAEARRFIIVGVFWTIVFMVIGKATRVEIRKKLESNFPQKTLYVASSEDLSRWVANHSSIT